MVRAASAGAYPPLHRQALASGNRAGGTPGFPALSVRLATPGADDAGGGRGRRGGGARTAGGLPGGGRGLGGRAAAGAPEALREWLAGCAVPLGPGGLGAAGRSAGVRRRTGVRHADRAAAASPPDIVDDPSGGRRSPAFGARPAGAGGSGAAGGVVLRRVAGWRPSAAQRTGGCPGRAGGAGAGQRRWLCRLASAADARWQAAVAPRAPRPGWAFPWGHGRGRALGPAASTGRGGRGGRGWLAPAYGRDKPGPTGWRGWCGGRGWLAPAFGRDKPGPTG